MEQRTNEWYTARKGLVTASKVIDILGQKALGLTGEGYAADLALAVLFPDYEEDSYTSPDMQRGIDLEPLAFNWFSTKMAEEFTEVQNCGFYAVDNIIGASPDGFVGEDAVLEIKCPRPKAFLKVVTENYIDPKYYAQMQCQMYCTNRIKAYYVNYIIINGTEQGYTIEISRDEALIHKMLERAKETIEIRDRIINEYLSKLK
jgi:putative phage-type endonuclease